MHVWVSKCQMNQHPVMPSKAQLGDMRVDALLDIVATDILSLLAKTHRDNKNIVPD